jgi:hypothetical protein
MQTDGMENIFAIATLWYDLALIATFLAGAELEPGVMWRK